MNRPGRITLTLLALALGPQAGANELYKCKNAAGKITYSGQECSQIGLTSAGEVKGKTNITPALKFPAPPIEARGTAGQASKPAPGVPSTGGSGAAAAAAPAAQPVAAGEDDPNRRCFNVKTAKGTSTRCNDTPEKTD
ncbi:MAG: hypothetical protein ACKVP9_18290 [Burkholderiales bacterium]